MPLSSKLWKIVVAHPICISHGCSSNFQTIRAPCRKYGRGKLIPVFNPAHQHHSNIRFGTSVFEHQEMEKTCTMALQPQKQMSRNSSLVVLFVTQAVFPWSIVYLTGCETWLGIIECSCYFFCLANRNLEVACQTLWKSRSEMRAACDILCPVQSLPASIGVSPFHIFDASSMNGWLLWPEFFQLAYFSLCP